MDYPTQSLDLAYDFAFDTDCRAFYLGSLLVPLGYRQKGHGLSRGRVRPQIVSTRWLLGILSACDVGSQLPDKMPAEPRVC